MRPNGPMAVSRRKPTQDRSREKYDLIVNAAKSLIGERGNDSVSVREIAKVAGVAPSSIYQYFPDKNAIVTAIVEGYFDQIEAMILSFTDQAKSVEDLAKSMEVAVDYYYQMFLQEPALTTIWASMQANPILRDLDTEDSIKNANLFADKLCELKPDTDHQAAFDASLLLIQMVGITIRMTLTMQDQVGLRLLEEFKILVRVRFREFIEN
ncbi:MAG: TetR/AcrR family transcriptional regulator [Pseudomonadales bacterium]|nr:TetR/AcrR family transcriptional regulator [Pseudomonadales bacterium]